MSQPEQPSAQDVVRRSLQENIFLSDRVRVPGNLPRSRETVERDNLTWIARGVVEALEGAGFEITAPAPVEAAEGAHV